MRILITGGAGYIGTQLTGLLAQNGHQVTVFDLFVFSNSAFFNHPAVNAIKGDIRNRNDYKDYICDADVLVHFAFVGNDPGRGVDIHTADSINRYAFQPLVEEFLTTSKAVRKKFILASSCSVYGTKGDDIPCTEETPPAPISRYAENKVYCEEILKTYSQTLDFSYTILRPATVHGYSGRQRFDLLLNNAILNMCCKNEINIKNPDCIRPSVQMNNLIRVYKLVIEDKSAMSANKIYNVGYENNSVMESVRKIEALLGKTVQKNCTNNKDQRSYRVNSERIRAELGYSPQFTVEQSVQEIKSALEGKAYDNPLANPLYYNNKAEFK